MSLFRSRRNRKELERIPDLARALEGVVPEGEPEQEPTFAELDYLIDLPAEEARIDARRDSVVPRGWSST